MPVSAVRGAKGTCSTSDSTQTCHYCHAQGHWKEGCPVLRSKSRHSGNVKSDFKSKFAHAPILSCSSVDQCGE